MICFRCQRDLPIEGKIARLDSCPKCFSDLHVCLNCNFYDPFAPKQCRETSAELVRDKEKSNFCEYFTPSSKSGISAKSPADEARKAFDNLFKKS
jgi:hypothetical protein